MMKRQPWIRYAAAFLLCLSLCAPLSACTPKESELSRAAAWLQEKYEDYNIFQSQAYNGTALFLAGSPLPGTDGAYTVFDIFVVRYENGQYRIDARKSVDTGISAGFTAAVLATDDLTVLFGDLTSSIYNISTYQRDEFHFTRIRAELSDGREKAIEIEGSGPYMLVMESGTAVDDVVYEAEEGSIRYSDYFPSDLMDNNGPDGP